MYDYRRWPDTHTKPERMDRPNWRWLQLWEQVNPRPTYDPDDPTDADWLEWYEQERAMHARIWVAYCLPQYNVWDWSDEDVQVARKLVAKHTCGVCGGNDDPGCVKGC